MEKPLIDRLVDKFLAWPLPESVCADLCATRHGDSHRIGTNLLTAIEARQMIEHLLGDQAHSLIIEWHVTGSGEYPDLKTFWKAHPDATIEAINGKECIGECESCNTPVLVGDKYQPYEDSVITCANCSDPDKLVTA